MAALPAEPPPVLGLDVMAARSVRMTPMETDPKHSAEQRRAARAEWPIVRLEAGAEAPDDLSLVSTPAERVAMMWALAQAAWKLAGRPLPVYDRRSIPARLFRPGTPPPDDDA